MLSFIISHNVRYFFRNSGDDSSPSNMDNTSYMGHFILLISYDEKTNEYLYLDPASKSPGIQCVLNYFEFADYI